MTTHASRTWRDVFNHAKQRTLESRLTSFFALVAIGVSVCFAPSAQAATVLIGDGVNNGNFVNASANYNTLSIPGWTSPSGQFWVWSGNSTLTTAPFGPDTATNSHAIQLHQPTNVVNNATFALTAGEQINFSIDVSRSGSGSDIAQIELFDGTNTISLASLTGAMASTFTQIDNNSAVVAVSGNYQYRMVYPGSSPDYMVDRVYLATTGPQVEDIPEPATMALLGLAVAGLGGYVKRRRRS